MKPDGNEKYTPEIGKLIGYNNYLKLFSIMKRAFIFLLFFTGVSLYGQSKLLKLKSPIIFKGDSVTAFRDPAVLYHNKTFYLFFTLIETERDGKVFCYTASSQSRDLVKWTAPVKNYSP